MKGRFEWHVTCDRQHSAVVRRIADEENYVYSEIAGCPLLGQGTYCYVTGYTEYDDQARIRVVNLQRTLEEAGVTVLRAKIENIVYDTKTGVDLI